MKNWKKTSLLTTIIIIALLLGAIYTFNLNITKTSSDIDFSPGNDVYDFESKIFDNKPKNIIVFIVDGMGFGHLSLALQTLQSEKTPSVWNEFDVKGWHDARSIYGPLTDSEASATAMTTGTSTNFGYIGIDRNGKSLNNIFEIASDQNYSTGVVTDSYIWDATPAAFIAHTDNEDNAREILKQIAASNLNLIFGELEDLGEGLVPEEDETFEILRKRFLLLDKSLELPDGLDASTPIAAIYDEDEVQDLNSSPNLVKLTDVALKHLTSLHKPFILLVESEEMDAASHKNDSERVIEGLKSIQQTLSLVLNFSKMQRETLVLFTSDHETGGLAAASDFGNYPKLQIRWSTKEHTAEVVPLFAQGPGAEYFANIHRNWEIGFILKKLISKEVH
jgi:alkaline phosphatase